MRRLAEEFFDDDRVAPVAVELRVALVRADLAEAEGAEQAAAGVVLGDDARDELPEAGRLRGADERFHRHASRPAAARRARDVDGELGDAAVAVARAVR